MEERSETRETDVSVEAEKGGSREWVSKLRYSRSFTAKLILSDDKIKEFFAGLSNALLSYEKTRTSRSRSGEGFYLGRRQFARLAFSGKTLCLYLSVDPTTIPKKRYKFIDVSAKKKYADVPAKLKIRSAGAYRYALSVIGKTAEERALQTRKVPLEPVLASQYPFEPFETLLARDLIRIILPKVRPDLTEEENLPAPTEEPGKTGQVEWMEKLRYSRSFLAKLMLSDTKVKEFYAAIATRLLSYEKVKSHLSWGGIGFTRGRTALAKIVFSGKTLCLYYATEPSAHEKGRYKFEDASGVKKYAQVPARIKIKSDRALAFVLDVIDKTMTERGYVKRFPALLPISAKDFPSDSFDNLLARGLIRLIRTKKKELTRTFGTDSVLNEGGGAGERIIIVQGGSKEGDGVQAEEGEVVRALSEESYQDTLLSNRALTERHEEYDIILGFLKRKTADIRLVKRYIVKTIDEKWVTAIEDRMNSFDDCLRKPSHFIEETERLLPIERTKKVTPRSIRHLCEHTDLIAKATEDEIIPTHLLNVFRDDTMMTYENKFLNTLLHRLYVFINDRYTQALKNGANEKVSVLSVTDSFNDGPIRGKMSFTLEIAEPHGENVRNSVKTKDLWRRVVKLRGIVNDYFKSELATNLGNTFIHPPVIRTNAILKNPALRDCLALWEFIESYEDEGNGITTEEKEIKLSDEYVDMIYHGLAEQYLVLRYTTAEKAAFVGGRQFDAGIAEESEEKTVFGTRRADFVPEENDEELIWAVEAAISADQYIDELDEEEKLRREALRQELLRLEEEERRAKEEDAMREAAASETPTVEQEAPETPKTEEEAPEVGEEEEESKEEKEDAEESEEGEETEEVVTVGGKETVIRYRKSFEARLRLAGEETKQYYCEIYNRFLSKDKVRVREGYTSVSFVLGRRTLARVVVVGRTLRVYFALDPASVSDKIRVKDCSDVKKFFMTPTMLKVRSARGLKAALTLVEAVCEGLGDTKKEYVKVAASDFNTLSMDRLVEMGLVQKRVTETIIEPPKPVVEEQQEEKKKPDLSGAGGDALIPQKEAMSDKKVKLTLEEDEKPKVEPIPEVRTEEVGGDALRVKPITLEEITAHERSGRPVAPAPVKQETAPQEEDKRKGGLLSRLFKRKK